MKTNTLRSNVWRELAKIKICIMRVYWKCTKTYTVVLQWDGVHCGSADTATKHFNHIRARKWQKRMKKMRIGWVPFFSFICSYACIQIRREGILPLLLVCNAPSRQHLMPKTSFAPSCLAREPSLFHQNNPHTFVCAVFLCVLSKLSNGCFGWSFRHSPG
jgi:hypothetical protein